MRRLTAFLSVLVGAAAVLFASAGVSNADNGNNLPLCSNEEICFWWDSSSFYEKQYWYNANHSGGFWHVVNGRYIEEPRTPVKDNALEITNKDSQCNVYVGNYLGNGSWTWEVFPNDHLRYFLRSVNNRNDYHQRCGV